MKGQCFPYAVQQAMQFGMAESESDFAVVHGVVHTPCAIPAHRYVHAWIEWHGAVHDWQTMKAGHGGKYEKKGYPKVIFYALYKPERIKTYTAAEAMAECLKRNHERPWTDDLDDVIMEQLDRQPA